MQEQLVKKYSNLSYMEEANCTEGSSYPTNSLSSLEDPSPESIACPAISDGNQQYGNLGKDGNVSFPVNDFNTSTLDQKAYVAPENKFGIQVEDANVNSSEVDNILPPVSLNEPKEVETPKDEDGASKRLKKDDTRPVLVDTAAPFESVKEAVTKFGGIVDWKAQKKLIMERRENVQHELERVREEMPKYNEQYEATEAVQEQVLKELDHTRRLVEELKLNLEKAETQEAQAKQDSELADLRLKEMEQGIANNVSIAAKAQLEVAKERHASAVVELRLIKRELESMKKEYVSLAQERDTAIKKAEDSVSASKEIEKTAEDLTLELIATKELLESAHSAHLEAEEQRIGAALALEQDKSNWEKELKQAEGELQQLNEQLLLTNDLKSKLDKASMLLVSLKAELASYIEAKQNVEANNAQEQMPPDQVGDRKETERNIQASLTTTTKELEEVRTNIEKANDEVNCLRVAVSSLKSELERERASLTTMRRRENLTSVSISSLEAELNRMNTELELILTREKEAREKMMDLPKALQHAAEEADQAKLVTNMAREELTKAKEEAEHAKAAASTMETRLNAALKEIEASKASEKLANAAVKALEESEQVSTECEDSSDGITLPIEEYYRVSKQANEAEELANQRVISATEQIRAAKESESRSLVKLEKASKTMEAKRKAQRAAVAKAEKATVAKLGAEQELRTWRAEHEQQRKVSRIARSMSDCSHLSSVREPENTADEADASDDSSTGNPRLSMPRSNTTNATPDSKRKLSFFPRIVMFLSRKKVQSLK